MDAGSAAPAQPQPAEPQPEPQPQQPPEPQPPVAAAPEAPRKASWLSRLKQGLSRTGQNIGGLFVGVKVDENLFEELESALIMADAGIEATEKLLAALRARVKKSASTIRRRSRRRCANCWPTICGRWSGPSTWGGPSPWWS